MSLSLIQGYSSAEEEDGKDDAIEDYGISSDENGDDASAVASVRRSVTSYASVFDYSGPLPPSSAASALPSALDVFSEISGPPQFLNNCVEEQATATDIDNHHQRQGRHGRWRNRNKDKKDLPAGAVVEAKAHLVGIHERVRSDIEANKHPKSSEPSTTKEASTRIPTATNPNAEEAAELLRMCSHCGIPKTYSSARGMVCPVCGDRPPSEMTTESKKKGSTIKDKEKNKRMKGQSSHATWKSETEMQLRQQYD
uniref:Uncharacterized protein MANES_14G166400 n=1 Tax=Rhizophora mucronata TaxID=61149 RepID=A0A2P2J8A7_RHIMU